MEEEEAQEGECREEPGEEDIIPRVERRSSSLSQPTEEGEEEEEEGREWGDISSEYSEYSSEEEDEEGLMSGALSERIQVPGIPRRPAWTRQGLRPSHTAPQVLRNRCTTALSPPVFLQVYGYIKGSCDSPASDPDPIPPGKARHRDPHPNPPGKTSPGAHLFPFA